MPRILEDKLKKEYPGNPHAVYGTLNKIGAMQGNKETEKGRGMEKALEKKKSAPYNLEAIHRNRHKRSQLHAEMKTYRNK